MRNALKKIFFILILSSSFLTAQNNMWPLTKGNIGQFMSYGTYPDGYDYSMFNQMVIKDTVINELKYFAFNNSGDFFRYDKDSNKAYLWYNGTEGLYCDFNLPNGSTFYQFKPIFHTFTQVTVTVDSQFIWGITRKIFQWATSYGFSRQYEKFAEHLGIIAKGSSQFGPGPDSESHSWIINTITFDSTGNYEYYSNGYYPNITFTPFSNFSVGLFLTFSAEVSHPYNRTSSYRGNLSDGIVYIDSVFVQFYYKKDSVSTSNQVRYASRTMLTNKYDFLVLLDTALLRNDYKLIYRIGAKDKSIIPVYKYSPDSGYYQAVYQPTSFEDESSRIKTFSLSQNYPNPFNPSTKIEYAISSPQNATLKVYDVLGNEVATLVNEYKSPGTYEVEFPANSGNSVNLPSGVYFYQLKAGDFVQTKKMVLLR